MDHSLETHCLVIKARRSFLDEFRGRYGRVADGDGSIVRVAGVLLTCDLPDQRLAALKLRRDEACLVVETTSCEHQPQRGIADRHRRAVLPSRYDGLPVHYLHRPQ